MATFKIASTRAPTQAEIRDYLLTLNGLDMVHIMRGITEPAAQVAFATKLLLTPPLIVGPNATPEKADKAKKALNAFVGFRCYYISIPVFKVWPMKKLSNLLGQLWEQDSNKSLWSLMTKAWSAMRDQVGKDKVPLDKFFHIVCPYLNIPSPDTYLERQGWKLEINEEDSPILSRDPNSQSFTSSSAGFTDMTLSVEDIISVCQAMGYAQDYVSDHNATSPTFLARSTFQPVEKKSQQQLSTQVGRSMQDMRVAARNKRRAKRQTARESGGVPALRQQIINTHDAISDRMYQDDRRNGIDGESTQFYNQLTALLANHDAQGQPQVFGQPSDTASVLATNDPSFSIINDWSAFRLGADENATLPSFGSSNV